MGNLINRLVGVGLGLATLSSIGPWLVTIEPDPARALAIFHTGFNLVLALLFLPVLQPFAGLLRRCFPERVNAADPSQPLYLAQAAREAPTIALAGAAREALRMADVLDIMLHRAWDALKSGDRKHISETRRLDDVLDRLNAAIRSYATGLDPEDLSQADHRRLSQILAFTTNIEHAGDVLDRNVMAPAAKRLKHGLTFLPHDRVELPRLFDRLSANLRTAGAVFMTEDGGACTGGGEGGVPALGSAGDGGAFREAPARAGGRRRERSIVSGRDAGSQADQHAPCRGRRVSGAGGRRRAPAQPPPTGPGCTVNDVPLHVARDRLSLAEASLGPELK